MQSGCSTSTFSISVGICLLKPAITGISFFSFNKIIITPLVQGVTEVFMYYLWYFCGAQKILWIIWTVTQFLFIVLLTCTINVHCIVKKAIPSAWIISCVLARKVYYHLRDIYISSTCLVKIWCFSILIVVIGSLMLGEYGRNGLNQVVGVNLWWARGCSTFNTVTAAEDVSYTWHAHGMCFFNFYNNMKLLKHSTAHL